MRSKAPKKLTSGRQRKRRPQSVYSKGWKTRRMNAALKGMMDFEPKVSDFNVAAIETELKKLGVTGDSEAAKEAGWNPVTVAEAAQMQQSAENAYNKAVSNQIASGVSGGDAILRTVTLHRDEQLCGFMADMQVIRRTIGLPAHAPMMVSRSQIEAIEDLLSDLGYSMFGKGSGAPAAVSTNPNAKAA